MSIWISGYVIPASWERSKSNQEYLKKRVVRIYPALWGATFFSLIAIMIFGMAYSHLKVRGIDIMTWLLGQLTFFQFYTPSSIEAYGVGNPNGSLWTISMEIQIYILIMLLYGWLKRRNKKEWLILMGGGIACNVIFSWMKPYLPSLVFKLINVTFIPYLYIYQFGMFAYTFRQELMPKLSRLFWPILTAYIAWSFANGVFFNFNVGHYVNIVSGMFICLLTLSGGYHFGKHRFKYDFSYSIYLYHMIVINVLTIVGINQNVLSVVLTYVFTVLLSCLSVFVIENKGKKFCEEIFRI